MARDLHRAEVSSFSPMNSVLDDEKVNMCHNILVVDQNDHSVSEHFVPLTGSAVPSAYVHLYMPVKRIDSSNNCMFSFLFELASAEKAAANGVTLPERFPRTLGDERECTVGRLLPTRVR